MAVKEETRVGTQVEAMEEVRAGTQVEGKAAVTLAEVTFPNTVLNPTAAGRSNTAGGTVRRSSFSSSKEVRSNMAGTVRRSNMTSGR
jgi:hypothetical protein